MAKKKDKDKTLLMAVILGVGVYMLTRSKPATTTIPPNYNQVPPAPVQNTPAWQQWVAAIISVFGTTASLWAPGGPFYKQPISQNQAIEIANSQQYSNYV